jgi:hypothetical protein
MKVPHALDSEFRRVAQAEGITMEELVAEIAKLTKRSNRHIYNFRCGKWPIPDKLFPIFCKRFGSLALANALLEECRETPVTLPEKFDLTKLVSQTVRDDLKYYEAFLDDFESDGIDSNELSQLRILAERVISNAYRFVEIAARDCERRKTRQDAATDSKSNGTPTELSNGTR